MKDIIPRLAGHRVLVIGDVCLDEYLIGRATRMSREAPVPVLEFESRQLIPGSAANPAANIAALGSTAILAGVIGTDAYAGTLCEVLKTRGIDTHLLLQDSSRPTTVKVRLMAQMGLRFPQQVARIDTLSREPISSAIKDRLCELISAEIPQVSGILMSDYHTGLLTNDLVNTVRDLAKGAKLMITADAQGSLDKYSGFTVVKCNADDAQGYLRRDLRSNEDFAQAARELCDVLRLSGAMVITRGAEGATIAECGKTITHCPAPAVTDVYDTVGAGDTAIAVLTLALLGGADYATATSLSNYASGLVVRRVGNYTPTREELQWAVENWKL